MNKYKLSTDEDLYYITNYRSFFSLQFTYFKHKGGEIESRYFNNYRCTYLSGPRNFGKPYPIFHNSCEDWILFLK